MQQRDAPTRGRCYAGDSIDDLMRHLLTEVITNGSGIKPSAGPAKEIWGVTAELTNPRHRFSRSQHRGLLISALGEFCWYMAGSSSIDFIRYYIPKYKELDENGSAHGAYGPRLQNWNGRAQLANVIDMLRRKPDSRQTVLQLFDLDDLQGNHKDVPCTCTIQLMLRQNVLHAVTYMRSNDLFVGFPHDIFSFTMLQEYVARMIGAEVGSYVHTVGSLHVYDKDLSDAASYVAEGWQSLQSPMPPMPLGNPSAGLNALLSAEERIRNGNYRGDVEVGNIDEYWADLIRILSVYGARKAGDNESVTRIRKAVKHETYNTYLRTKEDDYRG